MNRLKKFIAIATLAIMATGTLNPSLNAEDCYVTGAGGWGYEASTDCPSMTPYIALVTVVIIAIVAIAVRHHHGHHHHGHCH